MKGKSGSIHGQSYYSVYLRRTDELICAGTSAECAAALGRSVDSFYCMVSRVRKGKNRKYEVYQEDL